MIRSAFPNRHVSRHAVYVKSYFAEKFADYSDDEYEVDLEENKPTVFTRSKDGKVITLDFNTKTHGSA